MSTILYYSVGLLVFIFCANFFLRTDIFNLKCIVSKVDGNTYCVRDRINKQRSADLLAKVSSKCQAMVKYLKDVYPEDERVKRLQNGFNPKNMNEVLPSSKLTAYSENKGEKVAFCLNKKEKPNETDEHIDLHTLTFVALHELTHIMCKTYGHNQEFWNNFKFILDNAEKAGIHKSKDYKQNPVNYCGMTISDNPYFDL